MIGIEIFSKQMTFMSGGMKIDLETELFRLKLLRGKICWAESEKNL
jgi:hypothetical protein